MTATTEPTTTRTTEPRATDAVAAPTEAVTARSGGAGAPMWHRLYDRFVDTGSPGSLSSTFRARRWRRCVDRFPDLASMTVLDLGGTVDGWSVAPVAPAQLTIVNREPATGPLPAGVEVVLGDACALDASITGRSWDLVFANSVIEHVGGHDRRVAFAESVRALAPHHWVQTPNRWFPVEPHFLVPGLQYLPTRWRALVIAEWPLNKWRPADRRTAMEAALELELIGRAELAHYFPTSAILAERVGPFTKSLVAVA